MWRLVMMLAVYLPVAANAQALQNGIVQEYNERAKKTPLAGVELNIRSAGSTVSDGKFALQFLTLKPGDRVNVRRIEKLGYEIFNKEAVEQWNLNPSEPFVVVMCRSDRFKKIRDNYQRVASESYARQLKKDEAALARLKSEGKIKEQEYHKQLYELRESYEKQLDNLDSYVDRFSRIDLSELSATEQEIILLVQEGKIEEAIVRYEEQNYLDKYLQEVSDIREVSSAMEQLSELKKSKEQSRDSLLAAIDRQVETLKLDGVNKNKQKILQLLQSVADADTTNVEWLLRTGLFLMDYIADYDSALSYFNAALSSAIALYGEEHLYVATSCNNIGSVYSFQGDYPKALEYHIRSMTIKEKVLGLDHPDLATSCNNIGLVYSLQEDYYNAMEYYNRALSIQGKVLGFKHPAIATSYNNISLVYQSQGEYAKALEYSYRALSIQEKVLGSEHLDVAVSCNNIGSVYQLQGDYSKALEYHNRALSIQEKVLGMEHPAIAVSCNNIGIVYSSQGYYSKALEYFHRALPIQEKVLGPNHPDVAMGYNNIGCVYDSQKDYVNALEYHTHALSIREKVLGREHNDVAISCNNIGMIYKSQGDYTKALEYHSRALSIRKTVLGTMHPDVVSSLINIGLTYYFSGDNAMALENIVQALSIQEKMFGPEHPLTCELKNSIDNIREEMKSN